jgi:hypothetical protein
MTIADTGSWWRWWLGLEGAVDLHAARVVLERPIPGWGWFFVIAAALGLSWWSYARLKGDGRVRTVLGALRALVVLLVAVLLAGPALRIVRESIEEDWVLVLVDRSRSMSIRDAQTASAAADAGNAAGTADAGAGALADGTTTPTSRGRVTRDDALRTALERSESMWQALDRERSLVWLGFAGGAFDLVDGAAEPSGQSPSAASRDTEATAASPERAPTPTTSTSTSVGARDVLARLGAPSGDRTLLDEALHEALQRAAARPIAGIVVLTDGRTTAPPSRATLRRLQAAAAKVFVVPLGSETSTGDLAVAKVEAPRRAFVRDEVPVAVEIERTGLELVPAGGVVRLVDAATGAVVAEEPVPVFDGDSTTARVTLLAKPGDAGQRDWRVELDVGDEDLVAENNVRALQVELVDRPMRVLYIEGYPRWEYRYLKNLLIREESIESSVLLLSADRDFAQEGNMPITRLPRTREEFAQFDLVVLGDVPAGFFTPEQLEILRDQVAQRGTGLLWIGGERSMPKSWEGSPLAELLPMRGPLSLGAIESPVTMIATPAASALGLLKLGDGTAWPQELADPSVGWSRLEWAQIVPPEQLKPTAEVLAVGLPALERTSGGGAGGGGGGGAGGTSGTDGGSIPLVVGMKYGAGEIIYIATDEIWRWRYGRGERYTEQVWLPLVRMLGREALAGAGDAATFRAVPARVQLGQSVRLELVLNDARLAERGDSAMSAIVRPIDDGPSASTADATATSTEIETEIELVRTGRPGEFAASVSPEAVGSYLVRIPSGPAMGAEVRFECDRPDDETRRAAADHVLLADLARETDGAVVLPEALGTLPDLLPNRRVTTESATLEPLWDAPLALLLIVLLASLEWIGRRWLRLA